MAIFIAPTASVMGRVFISPDVSIWYGAVIRADVEEIHLGEGCNVQDNAVLHADEGDKTIIGKFVTVGHSAIVHGAEVGEGSLIGMHATVLNRAKIGKYCLIGAHALVTEGMEIPDYSLVLGTPAKVVKTLNESQIERLKYGPPHYIKMGKKHAKGEYPLITQADFES
ncbi:gamma carbonic anhydrase family protein [Aquirufa nivalisilvae]|uniref:Gamma carbonic anhydrase 2, mitochondrial n=1 Tax=Aquirufa nivalisilvae TaxID=2516557 RepID=A0A2S2DUS4_9BACT|nr:gamma carbonic anhydrase family protein [Aquirufa nivalisilvae]AWL08557.1 Gamma carbonic anhydrase 2, mitochondrial [Aquirufa nivalisilvae]MCZ2479027.1 gamma carbonic anhydrase family protein [Aquirufa nivalisilvae]MCZ2483308.1 gamma carbonic anhydrase family protein [Aquirufa nivalisilvae]